MKYRLPPRRTIRERAAIFLNIRTACLLICKYGNPLAMADLRLVFTMFAYGLFFPHDCIGQIPYRIVLTQSPIRYIGKSFMISRKLNCARRVMGSGNFYVFQGVVDGVVSTILFLPLWRRTGIMSTTSNPQNCRTRSSIIQQNIEPFPLPPA